VEVLTAGYPLPVEESPVLGVREIYVRIRGSVLLTSGSGSGRPKNLWFPNTEDNKTKNADPALFDSGFQEVKDCEIMKNREPE
jgi:hypothetical protein